MSEKTKLQVFERTIAIPGVRFTANAIHFERVDEEALHAAGAFLQAVDACAAWWWGDFLAAYCGYRLKADIKEEGVMDTLTQQDRLKQYSAQYSNVCGKEPKTLWHWKSVADFYNSSRRREELSWTHHIEAKDASAGDTAVADNWLDLAIKHQWSASQLRAAIRRSKRVEQEPEEPLPQLILPMELVECRRWATAAVTRAETVDIEEAKLLLAELQPVLALASIYARRIAAAEAPGGKESLFAA